jgi:TonB family protein
MTRTMLLLPWLLFMAAAPAVGQEALASAQKLYASAQYEEALKAFDGIKAGEGLPSDAVLKVEQGRVLCLLALDRKPDAQQAIEAILAIDPFYQPGEDDAAPKVRAAFREVRRRALPGALQQIYGRAKQAYDRKSYADAAADFKRVLTIVEDPDLTLEAAAKSDMRLVAQAFLDLATAAAAPPPAPAPAVDPQAAAKVPDTPARDGAPAAGAGAAAIQSPPAVYDAASKDVLPPVAVRTDVQIPPSFKVSDAPREAVVEIVVSATGTIDSAVMRPSVGSLYDALVTRAALAWRFRPATRGGAPVRYRMLVRVVLSAGGAPID